ncbi:asparagine synthase-related protein [Streptomyces sp. NPDC059786]|uniref:asparagine synthase-related protein n=1 Tax=Streptomyces sp. NPDC059786 TaxID=3346946 RepID=UPI003648EE67
MNTATSWFVVLPDRAGAAGPAARLRAAGGADMVPHPSGRPWLLGRWRPDEMAVVTAGDRRCAVIGTSSTTAPDLSARMKGVRDATDLERVLRPVHGSFHVVAVLDGHGYARGSAFGGRRLYWTTAGDTTVYADRAHTLARLTAAVPDPAQLAARLAVPHLPHPLAGAAMWTGVHTVPPGHALRTDPGGRTRTAAWWRPPAAELPPAEGATHLRRALRDAVALRVRSGRVLAADLSGGMDSTALCFLAAEAGARLVTATMDWDTPGNQDRHYARYAVERLPGTTSLVFASAELPACFTGLDRRRAPLDEPAVMLRDRARQRHLARALLAEGAVLRLSGHGGDHAVVPPPSYVHALLRREPRTALRHALGFAARDRWSPAATGRMLLDGRSYPAWLGRAHPGKTAAPGPWGPMPALPPWASDEAAERLAALLGRAAGQAEPLSADPGRHAWLHQMREAGRIAALVHDATSADGLPTDSPFCDDAVLTACAAVLPHHAGHPWSYKPLLAAALRGLVPAHLLDRTTKDHCGPDWHRGLKTHQRGLADWAESSHLVAAGVADEGALRRALLSPGLNGGGAPALENTLGAEEWLRDLAARPAPDPLEEEHPRDTTAAR